MRVETHAREGDPADAILDVAEEQGADLIVVGNKGMTGAKRFLLGSVPNKVSHHAPCSVMIIRRPPSRRCRPGSAGRGPRRPGPTRSAESEPGRPRSRAVASMCRCDLVGRRVVAELVRSR